MDSEQSEDFRRAKEAAYRFLTYKPRSRSELISRLEKKGFSKKIIGEIIKRLEEQKYVDDEAYGQAFASSLIQRRFLGREALRAELLKKGLDREVVERIIEESYAERDEGAIAILALEKKWNSLKGRPLEIARRRASDYLRRKGFPFTIIKRVLSEKFEM